MSQFSPETWALLGLIAAAAVLCVLGRLAAALEEGKRLHDTHLAAERLRQQYAAQLAAHHGVQEVTEVDIVEDADFAPAAAA